MITLHEVEQGSERWKRDRIGFYTGSNAYKLLGGFGASDYAKAIESSFTGNFATKRGHVLEGEMIELYEEIYRSKVNHTGFVTNTDYPNCLFSPDGFDGPIEIADGLFKHQPIILEGKAFGEKPHMEIFNGHINVKIMAQIQFGLMVCELKEARLIIYNPDIPEALRAFKVIPVKANRDIINNFKRILEGAA